MAAKKPNILFIMADQMAAPMLSMYNPDSVIQTPNLDHLAKSGVVFDSAYCNSPLCAPSRFTLVTGQLPSKIGAYDNASDLPADVPTYAHYLRREGYHTALAGKMHFCGPDQLHGYEQRLTSDIYPGDYGWTVNWDEPEIRPDWYHNMSSVFEAGPCVRTNQLDFDDEVIYKSTQYLYDHARYREEQPFCLTVSMTHPHDPYAMTKDYWDLYEGVDIPLPSSPAIPHDMQDPHSKRVLQCIDLYGREIPVEKIRAARRAYFAACTYVDAQVGKLMRTLDACGLADNTVVVFTGDHGDMLGERGLWYKMVWFEMAARVPMVVYAPGRYSPRRVQENVSSMDLLPTFVAIAGGALHSCLPLDGVSLIPYLTGETDAATDRVTLGEYMAEGTLCPVVMIRRGRWKFIYSPLDPPMLFDLVSDPAESVNLVTGCNIPSHSAVKASLGPSFLHLPYTAPAKPHFAQPPTPNISTASRNIPFQFSSQADLTPPLTPPITHHIHSSEPSAIVSQFLEEVHTRWDFEALTQTVLASQRRRRLVYAALMCGVPTNWEYSPPSTSQNYVRNRGKGALDDVEWRQRLPRISK